ncbi:MAG TPA: hypothetical protein VGJ84_10250 [Polyangiaceae bacterium]|jgi:uncharacterized protein (TIGR00290 family)
MQALPKAWVSWSTGKDSAFALYQARQRGEVEIVGVLTTVTAAYERVSMHGVREQLLDRQLLELGLPCFKVSIPSPCPNEIYEQRMAEAMAFAKTQGVTHVVFGDLFLEDIRAYREAKLAAIQMSCVFPLWLRDTRELAEEMLASGLSATLTCVDPKQLSAEFAGRTFDRALLLELPASVDPCGERGEFHTFATRGPMFRQPIPVTPGAVIERDGFVFADLMPV